MSSFTCSYNLVSAKNNYYCLNQSQKKAKYWARVAKTVYITNLPFSHYNNKYVATYLYNLDFSYKAPSHGTLVGSLLNQCYEKVKSKVDAWLYTSQFLNFYMDKSNNIRKDRVINFLTYTPKGCSTKRGCFYIRSESNGAKTMDAKAQAGWLINQIIEITERKL